MSDAPEELILIGYEKLTEHGFALPCFGRTVGANTVYVARATQPGDPLAAIASFDVYEPDEIHLIPYGREPTRAWTGGPWVDVFLWNNELFAGTKPEIWQLLDSVRTAIAAVAPLTLLNLAEGVPEVASCVFARAAFNWLERHQNTANAKAWLIGTYLRDVALRTIRRYLGEIANSGRVRQALLQVRLEPEESCVVLRLPFLLTELLLSAVDQFSDLSKAAQEFGIQISLPVRAPVATTATHWTKKITASDAQRKRAGNQRGSITLVRANYKIDAQTYFRRDFFGPAGKNRTPRYRNRRREIQPGEFLSFRARISRSALFQFDRGSVPDPTFGEDLRVDADLGVVVTGRGPKNARIPGEIPLGKGRHDTTTATHRDLEPNRVADPDPLPDPAILHETPLSVR